MTVVQVDDLMLTDESGFACSKTKLVDVGLPHLRPFNISDDGSLYLGDIYQVPIEEAPDSKRELLPGDVLFNNTNSVELVGKSTIVRERMVAGYSNHITRIRVNAERIEPEYFALWLRQLRSTGFFSSQATQWVSQAAFRASELRKLALVLPEPSEQRRIVDLLTHAEGIVRLRREAQQKAAELIPAIFIDMFGDPATNPKGWPVLPMSELVAEFRYGTSQKSGPTGTPVLRIPNVIGGAIDLAEVKLVMLPQAEHQRLRLVDGDLLFVRTNGNPDFVGRCSVYESSAVTAAGFDGADCVYA